VSHTLSLNHIIILQTKMTTIITRTHISHQNLDGDTHEQLLADIRKTSVAPLWEHMKKLNPALPNPQTIPFLWKYKEIRPNLLRAGKMVTEKQAERRVLMLVNPNRGKDFYNG
jgi:gentisate 1,2-dioxygenase